MYRDNGCRSPKLPLSSGSCKTKADMISQYSTSPMLVTASSSCQDTLHCINTMLKSAPFTLVTLPVPSCPMCQMPPPFQGVQYLLATASFCLNCSPRNSPFFPQLSLSSFLLRATLLKMGFLISTGPEHPSPSWSSGVGTTLLNSGPVPSSTIPGPMVALPVGGSFVVTVVEHQVLLFPALGLSPLLCAPFLHIMVLPFQVHSFCC